MRDDCLAPLQTHRRVCLSAIRQRGKQVALFAEVPSLRSGRQLYDGTIVEPARCWRKIALTPTISKVSNIACSAENSHLPKKPALLGRCKRMNLHVGGCQAITAHKQEIIKRRRTSA